MIRVRLGEVVDDCGNNEAGRDADEAEIVRDGLMPVAVVCDAESMKELMKTPELPASGAMIKFLSLSMSMLKRQPPRVCGTLLGSGLIVPVPPTLIASVVVDEVELVELRALSPMNSHRGRRFVDEEAS